MSPISFSTRPEQAAFFDTSTRRILVLGDVMIDNYVIGSVRRMSPEAPIPVLFAEQRRSVLGGAANVARNIASLGAWVTLLGVTGADRGAETLAELTQRAGRIDNRTLASPARPTTVKTRFMAGNHQLLRLDEEAVIPVEGVLEQQLLAVFEAEVARADIVILSDYAKGVLTDSVLRGAIALARSAGKPIIADPKRAMFSAYAGASVLTPNLMEVARATGMPTVSNREVEAAGRAAMAQAGAAAVVVTRSEQGLTLVSEDGPALHLPTRARAVADVSGAGDTFIATLAIVIAGGGALAEAAAIANVGAGLSVAKPGTATIELEELLAALHHTELLTIDDKVASLPAALSRVAEWRAQGLRVGLTNGCFDLIHPGHVRLLQKARAACDRLIVALNSDASLM